MWEISQEAILRRQPSDGRVLCRGNRAATFSDLILSLATTYY